ncbi:MAG: hypothetical protein FJX89_01395 [Bacteroidetes bacterium]|nr:hypothetical protein [Bacteroidota bacterium]
MFNDILSCPITVTHNRSFWEASALTRIHYSGSPDAAGFWIPSSGFVLEEGIRPFQPAVSSHEGLPVLFPYAGGGIPFDILSAAFYLVSRYEEYLPHATDAYGRFSHRSALAWKGGFLGRPLVDLWALTLRRALQLHFPGLSIPARHFRLVPTYDIDIAWAHRHRGWFRSVGGAVRALGEGRLSDLSDRLLTQLSFRPDPYDAYVWLDALHQRYGLDPLYFFLVALSRGRYDRNITPSHPKMKALLATHARQYSIGLHPSWQSGDDARLLAAEAAQLLALSGMSAIRHSRQHYLRFRLPQTPRQLIGAGITDDYSMGYGAAQGFRASTCTPFRWYDLEAEKPSLLRLHPFCFMDATAHHELGMDAGTALSALSALLEETRQAGGEMVTVFHNSMLGTHRLYPGWREMYVRYLDMATGGSSKE